MKDKTSHELVYRAGLSGFGSVDDVPHWACTCGQWRINRNLMTGNPQKETAVKRHRVHTRDAEHTAPTGPTL